MVPEVWVWPVEVADEGLQRVQLPEQVLGGRAPVAGNSRGQHRHRGTCGQVGVGFILASCETAGKIPSDTFPEVRQF